jgi:hypothetical protein
MRVPDRCFAERRERGYLVFESFLGADERIRDTRAGDGNRTRTASLGIVWNRADSTADQEIRSTASVRC